MKKGLLFILISLLFIGISNVKGVTSFTDLSDNQDASDSSSSSTSSCSFLSKGETGFCGSLLQGIKVSLYDNNNNLITGAGIENPKYFKIKGSIDLSGYPAYGGIKYCYTNSDHLVSNYKNSKGGCYTDRTFKFNNSILSMYSTSGSLFGDHSVNGATFNNKLLANNRYYVNEILKAMNYKNSSNTYQHYMVVEPVITVAVNEGTKSYLYSGTVNALIANNVKFNASGKDGYTFVNTFSIIAAGFRSKINNSTNSCKESTTNSSGNVVERIVYGSSKDYSGCGYSTYALTASDGGSGECKIDYSVGCLSASVVKNSTCKATDYTFTYDYDGVSMNCSASYNLKKNVDGGDSISPWGPVKSGKAYLGGTSKPQVVTTGVLNVNCTMYSDKADKYTNADPFSELKYENFVNGVKYDIYVNGVAQLKNLDYTVSSPKTKHSDVTNYNSTKKISFSKTYTAYYYTPKATINRTTGIIEYNTTNASNNTSLEAYGFYTKLEDNLYNKMKFEVSLNNKNFGLKDNVSLNGTCYYTTSNPDFKDVEIRLIDTKNPFAGENGVGRKTGSNWCYGDDCSSMNPLVVDKIINRNNSYDILGEGPIYKFILTPETINIIRDSNSELSTTYNSTKCIVNDDSCRRSFFTSIKDSILVGSEKLTK